MVIYKKALIRVVRYEDDTIEFVNDLNDVIDSINVAEVLNDALNDYQGEFGFDDNERERILMEFWRRFDMDKVIEEAKKMLEKTVREKAIGIICDHIYDILEEIMRERFEKEAK